MDKLAPIEPATVELVANGLGPLAQKVMFTGGAIVRFLLSDPVPPEVRATDDIDVVVEVNTYSQYVTEIVNSLKNMGFVEDTNEGAPTCRWFFGSIKVDVMPTFGPPVGPINRWAEPAFPHALNHRLPGGTQIRVISAPYFLGTKLEALRQRGGGDLTASHDLEDVIILVDGRPEIVEEVASAEADLRDYVAEQLRDLLGSPEFEDALPGHLAADEASQARQPTILRRLRAIAGGG
jgi:hypothetical protein